MCSFGHKWVVTLHRKYFGILLSMAESQTNYVCISVPSLQIRYQYSVFCYKWFVGVTENCPSPIVLKHRNIKQHIWAIFLDRCLVLYLSTDWLSTCWWYFSTTETERPPRWQDSTQRLVKRPLSRSSSVLVLCVWLFLYHVPKIIRTVMLCCLLWRGTWWRHQMETFSAILAICAGISPLTGELPAQRPVTRSFDVFSDLRLNKRLSEQSRGWWFETPSRPWWRHINDQSILSISFRITSLSSGPAITPTFKWKYRHFDWIFVTGSPISFGNFVKYSNISF